MLRRLCLVLAAVVLFCLPLITHAQTTPQQVNDALADLSAKLGRSLTLANMGSWSYEQSVYPDTSLGCPLAGQTYTQVQTSGYRVLFTYQGTTYDYRVSADRKILFLCSPNLGSNVPATPVPTTSAPQNVVVGQVVCTGSMAARLWVGGQGTSIATGSVNIRQQPTQSSAVAGLLLPNGQFNVTGGPRCDGIKTWWQISYVGSSGLAVNGWVMEGDATSNDYWLQPIGTPPASTGNTTLPTGNGLAINASNAAQIKFITQGALSGTPITAAFMPNGDRDLIVITSPSRAISYYPGDAMQMPTTFPNGERAYYAIGAATNQGQAPLLRMATAESVLPGNTTSILRLWEIGDSAGIVAVERYAFQLPFKSINKMGFSLKSELLAVSTGASGSTDPTAVWIWETGTGVQRAPLMHSSPVGAIAFSSDSKMLVSACADGSVHIWDLATQTEVKVLAGTAGSDLVPPAIALSPNGTQLAVGRATGAVELYAFPAGTPQVTIQATSQYTPVRFLAFSTDSTVLAVGGAGASDAATAEHSISLWNASTGAVLGQKIALSEPLAALDFSVDGARLMGVGSVGNWWWWGIQ